MLDPAGPPGDAADEVADRGRVGVGEADQDVEAGDVFAALDLVEPGTGEGGALGRLLLVESGQLARTVEVVREPRQSLEGKRRLRPRAGRHREPFGVSTEAGLTGALSGLSGPWPFRSTTSHDPGPTSS